MPGAWVDRSGSPVCWTEATRTTTLVTTRGRGAATAPKAAFGTCPQASSSVVTAAFATVQCQGKEQDAEPENSQAPAICCR